MPEGIPLDPERLQTLSQAILSFLNICVSGEAETVFQNADSLEGFEAWRRIIKYIDHGKEIKLERMRTEMKSLHWRQIKNLEGVPHGIAEIELMWKEYTALGGPSSSDCEKKSDLL